jgi:hypothetical protein
MPRRGAEKKSAATELIVGCQRFGQVGEACNPSEPHNLTSKCRDVVGQVHVRESRRTIVLWHLLEHCLADAVRRERLAVPARPSDPQMIDPTNDSIVGTPSVVNTLRRFEGPHLVGRFADRSASGTQSPVSIPAKHRHARLRALTKSRSAYVTKGPSLLIRL